MAEFVEVMKQKKRMCETYGMSCRDCELYMCGKSVDMSNCDNFAMEHPQQAEEIIMKWTEEHPAPTNADKFKEVFGFEPNDDTCPYKADKCEDKCNASSCSKYNFWQQEYKEPKGE